MPRFALALVLALAAAGIALAAPTPGSDPYEAPPTLQAAEILPAELLEGTRHAVDPEARTDGYMVYFTVNSHYGTYQTASIEETTLRIREIYAIETLEDMKRYEIAAEGVVEGIKEPFLSVRNVISRPEETLENLGEGIGRWIERGKLSLHKAGRKAKKAASEAKETYDRKREERRAERLAEQEIRDRAVAEGQDPDLAIAEYQARRDAETDSDLAAQSDARRNQERALWVGEQLGKASRRYLGYDKARRQLARSLGADPYTTNVRLQETLDAKAWSLWAGAFGIDFVLPSSRAVDTLQDVDELVWTTGPKDLEVANRKVLKAMGIERRTIDGFFENRWYTPSDRTHMIRDLETLADVETRGHLFELAQGADERLQALFYQRSARMLARAHARSPLHFLVQASDTILAAVSQEKELLLFLPVDHLSWSETADLVSAGIARGCREHGFEGRVRILLGGDLTSRAREELEALGWSVETWILDHPIRSAASSSDPEDQPELARSREGNP